MNATELKDHELFGSFEAIAKVCGMSREAVRKWDRVPLDRCAAIERATNGVVRCEDMRPDVVWIRSRGKVVGYTVKVAA